MFVKNTFFSTDSSSSWSSYLSFKNAASWAGNSTSNLPLSNWGVEFLNKLDPGVDEVLTLWIVTLSIEVFIIVGHLLVSLVANLLAGFSIFSLSRYNCNCLLWPFKEVRVTASIKYQLPFSRPVSSTSRRVSPVLGVLFSVCFATIVLLITVPVSSELVRFCFNGFVGSCQP
ncbi:hypothetical protein MFC_01429 [Mesomycoplasma flocculare ATCC 27716]|nr:hypothetical protein MFC_01429 [Mesomycoplasma flocculare ATCC 27716]